MTWSIIPASQRISILPVAARYAARDNRSSVGQNLKRAFSVCAALGMVAVGFTATGIADLFTSPGRPPHPGDLF